MTANDDALINALLAVPNSPHKPKRVTKADDFTAQIEVGKSSVSVTVNDKPGVTTEGTARDFLIAEGLNPDDWEVTGLKKSQWGDSDNPKESVAFTFKRVSVQDERESMLPELLEYLNKHKPKTHPLVDEADQSVVVVIGDMQFGKMDGDGPEGAVTRTLTAIDGAAERIVAAKHIHVAWMGDHIEGFVSQGGANVWRTQLTLNEQIRLTRRVMAYAMQRLAPFCDRLTMAAVPGNHGEPQRFNGKGVTRYDDSHDTEALVAVSEAAALSEHFDHVEFYVPETDEMTVILEVGGVTFAHAHGHQWRPNKHFEWWRGQAFDQNSSMHMADVLLAGHLHHGHIEEDGKRLYVGCPALEAESTWYRHSTGTGGNPGILLLRVDDREVKTVEFIRPKAGD